MADEPQISRDDPLPTLTYRDFREDLPYSKSSRWWPITRCFFYAFLFAALSLLLGRGLLIAVGRDHKWLIFLITVFLCGIVFMFCWSVRSLVRMFVGRTRDPFA